MYVIKSYINCLTAELLCFVKNILSLGIYMSYVFAQHPAGCVLKEKQKFKEINKGAKCRRLIKLYLYTRL